MYFYVCYIQGISRDQLQMSGQQEENYIRFTVNGQSYDFEPSTLTSLSKLIMGVDNHNDINTRISLWMPLDANLGSHDITNQTTSEYYNADVWLGDDKYTSTSGTLTITEIVTEDEDEYILGTFNFTGVNFTGETVTVTNGSFRAYN